MQKHVTQMPDWTTLATEILAAITAGGWLLSRRRRRQETESHEAEMAKAKAELTAALRESETKYTREALEIYTHDVVEPIRQQCERNTIKLARFEAAVDLAPTCRIYPDCVIIRELRASQKADADDIGGNPQS